MQNLSGCAGRRTEPCRAAVAAGIISLVLILTACQRAAQNPHVTAADVVRLKHNFGATNSPFLGGTNPAPSPRPTSFHCWIYNKIYPTTQVAYEQQHVTTAERREIQKWAAPVSPEEQQDRTRFQFGKPPLSYERGLVRWMRDPGAGILVFVTRATHHPNSTGYWWWVAINSNMIIDTRDCDVHAFPTAQGGAWSEDQAVEELHKP